MAETDYLAKVAAKTVACDTRIQDMTIHMYHDEYSGGCPCKGSGQVLDPRFERLRKECKRNHYDYGDISHEEDGCIGYTIVRDVGVLLDIIPAKWILLTPKSNSNDKYIFAIEDEDGRAGKEAGGDDMLEAVAAAVYQWLEGSGP